MIAEPIKPALKSIIIDHTTLQSLKSNPDLLDQLDAQIIVIDSSVTMPIPPNLIPNKSIHLILPANYIYHIDDSSLPSAVCVYLRPDNIKYAPTDRNFFLWEKQYLDLVIPELDSQKITFELCENISTDYLPIYTSRMIRLNELRTIDPDKIEITTHSLNNWSKKSSLVAKKIAEQIAIEITSIIYDAIQEAVNAGTFHNGFNFCRKYNPTKSISFTDLVYQLEKRIPSDYIKLRECKSEPNCIIIRFNYSEGSESLGKLTV